VQSRAAEKKQPYPAIYVVRPWKMLKITILLWLTSAKAKL
jgi:hypothetical protein